MPNSKTTGKRREVRGRARRGKKTIKLLKFQILRGQYKINVGGGGRCRRMMIMKSIHAKKN